MESTSFEMMIWPVSLTTFATMGACWLLSSIARLVNRIISGASRNDRQPDNGHALGPDTWDQTWARPTVEASIRSRPLGV
jgi:hypothetical protein